MQIMEFVLPPLSHLSSYMFPLKQSQRWVLQWQVIKLSLLGLELSRIAAITVGHKSQAQL